MIIGLNRVKATPPPPLTRWVIGDNLGVSNTPTFTPNNFTAHRGLSIFIVFKGEKKTLILEEKTLFWTIVCPTKHTFYFCFSLPF